MFSRDAQGGSATAAEREARITHQTTTQNSQITSSEDAQKFGGGVLIIFVKSRCFFT
jgi:hypothetical protein